MLTCLRNGLFSFIFWALDEPSSKSVDFQPTYAQFPPCSWPQWLAPAQHLGQSPFAHLARPWGQAGCPVTLKGQEEPGLPEHWGLEDRWPEPGPLQRSPGDCGTGALGCFSSRAPGPASKRPRSREKRLPLGRVVLAGAPQG